MITSMINGITVLAPESENNSITNLTNDFYSKEVWLGKNDTVNNYKEVPTPIDKTKDRR